MDWPYYHVFISVFVVYLTTIAAAHISLIAQLTNSQEGLNLSSFWVITRRLVKN
jgi:hypothetical protein